MNTAKIILTIESIFNKFDNNKKIIKLKEKFNYYINNNHKKKHINII